MTALTHSHVERDRELLREVPAIDIDPGGRDTTRCRHCMKAGRPSRRPAAGGSIPGFSVSGSIGRRTEGAAAGGSLPRGHELPPDRRGLDRGPDLVDAVEVLRREFEEGSDTVPGQTSTEPDSRRASVRSGEAAIGNLVAGPMRMADSMSGGCRITQPVPAKYRCGVGIRDRKSAGGLSQTRAVIVDGHNGAGAGKQEAGPAEPGRGRAPGPGHRPGAACAACARC